VSRVLRPDYTQRFLLPPALEDWVPANHPVRFVRDFVDSLDLPSLGIHEPAAKEGRPPYAPDMLLKVWLFGYMDRVRSVRGLEKACMQVMPFLWLTGNLHPDHNTLWRFFSTHRAQLPKLFKQLVKLAAEAELIGFALHAIDGTKLTAASSTDEALHRKSLQEKLKHLDPIVDAYMQAVAAQAAEDDKGKGYAMPAAMANDEARRARIVHLLKQRIEDREDDKLLQKKGKSKQTVPTTSAPEGASSPATPPSVETPTTKDEPPQEGRSTPATPTTATPAETPAEELLREAILLKKELQANLAKLDAADVNHLHEAEPEARMMKGRGAAHALGYNGQIVVDHESDLIVACEVVAQQNDIGQLVPMLDRVHETLGRVAEQTVADGGYGTGEQFKRVEERGMKVVVVLRQEQETKGDYSKAHFNYDAATNAYVCPKGERLLHVGSNKSHASAQQPDAIYRCRNKTCPVRAQCTTDPRGRQVRRPYGEEARERQAEKQQDPRMRTLLGLRKEIVEHLFGIVKGVDGFRRFTVRGLEKAQAQWALVCSAVNLRKLHTFWLAGSLRLPSQATGPA
jgi:transposase